MAKNFNELRAKMTDSRRTANEIATGEMIREYALSQIRREAGFTQEQVAAELGVTQPAYAACERGSNLRIGTLQKIVSAIGGVLSFHVELDGRDYSLQLPRQASMA